MPNYKLTYFDGRARAETARMLFKLAGQPFEDIRLDFEEWPKVKESYPMGQLPVLDIDGVMLCQSNAIGRFLAKQYGFAGRSALESAQIDAVVDSVEDLTTRIGPLYDLGSQPEEKAKYVERYRTEYLYPGLGRLEKLLEKNNEGNGFFVGDTLTWADITFLNIGADYACMMGEGNLDGFPKLKALKERVEAIPQIADWIKERKVTPF